MAGQTVDGFASAAATASETARQNVLTKGESGRAEMAKAEQEMVQFSIEEQLRKAAIAMVSKAIGNAGQNIQTLVQAA